MSLYRPLSRRWTTYALAVAVTAAVVGASRVGLQLAAPILPNSAIVTLAVRGGFTFAEDELKARAGRVSTWRFLAQEPLSVAEAHVVSSAATISLRRIAASPTSSEVLLEIGWLEIYARDLSVNIGKWTDSWPNQFFEGLLVAAVLNEDSIGRGLAIKAIKHIQFPQSAIPLLSDAMIAQDHIYIVLTAHTTLLHKAQQRGLDVEVIERAWDELESSPQCRVPRPLRTVAQIQAWTFRPDLIERVSPRPDCECEARDEFVSFIDEWMRASMAAP